MEWSGPGRAGGGPGLGEDRRSGTELGSCGRGAAPPGLLLRPGRARGSGGRSGPVRGEENRGGSPWQSQLLGRKSATGASPQAALQNSEGLLPVGAEMEALRVVFMGL